MAPIGATKRSSPRLQRLARGTVTAGRPRHRPGMEFGLWVEPQMVRPDSFSPRRDGFRAKAKTCHTIGHTQLAASAAAGSHADHVTACQPTLHRPSVAPMVGNCG